MPESPPTHSGFVVGERFEVQVGFSTLWVPAKITSVEKREGYRDQPACWRVALERADGVELGFMPRDLNTALSKGWVRRA